MRKLLISLAAAGTALAAATPAAAQFYPQPSYGYGNNNYGQGYARNPYQLQARIDNVQRQIDMLARRGQLRGESAGHLMEETRQLEYRLRSASRYGLNGWEARDVQQRIGLIEQRVRYAASNGYGNRYGNQWNGGYYGGRDRDDRNRYDRDDD